MKKYLYLFTIITLALYACDKDDSNSEPEPEPAIVYSEIGVWEYNHYFIALNSDHTISAYFAPNYIDGGTYSISDNVITCKNTYYMRTTTYTINSIDNDKMNITISYVTKDGEEKVTSLELTKSDKEAPSMYNPLVGKSFCYYDYSFGDVTYSFEANCMGTKSASKGSARKYPLRLFYITLENRFYYLLNYSGTTDQVPTIGGWTGGEMDDLNVMKVTFNTDGSIASFEKVNEYL